MARRLEGCSCEGVEGEPVCGEPTAHGCGGSGGISVVGAAAGGAVGAFGGEGGAAPGDGGRQGGLVLFRLRRSLTRRGMASSSSALSLEVLNLT